jgi:predicted glycosyltransferase
VPDFENEDAIAGVLSHPKKTLNNIKYIGCLSRFEKQKGLEKEYQLLILISGPEPQRTIFENKLLEQIKNFEGKILFVRGLPGKENKAKLSTSNNNMILKDHLPSDELCKVIQQSEMVICRSGYTSVMDLIRLKQKAILVPTPGQSEQEYLADHLHEQKVFYSVSQDKFQLKESLNSATHFKFKIPDADMNVYKKVIGDFVNRL